jgi:RNA polymerase sigma factor (sigma-70 family)
VWSASDEALVAGMAAGDPDAALLLVRRFQTRVYGLALALARDATIAEDVAQEAFVRAWRYGASYDPRRGSVAAWLLTITRNAALDQLAQRSRRLQRVQPAADTIDEVVDVAYGFTDPADGHAERALLSTALAGLPPEQRQALVGAAWFGWTAREMSERWNVPVGTIKTRLRLAMQKLREAVMAVVL